MSMPRAKQMAVTLVATSPLSIGALGQNAPANQRPSQEAPPGNQQQSNANPQTMPPTDMKQMQTQLLSMIHKTNQMEI